MSDCSGKPRRTAYPIGKRREAVALYEQGHGAKYIGRALGIDRTTVRSWLRRYRMYGEAALQPNWRPSSGKPPGGGVPERFAEALQLYAGSNLTRAEVCRRCGVDYHAFSYYLQRYHPQDDIASRRAHYNAERKRKTREKYREAVELYASTDLSGKEICGRLGLSLSGFLRHIRTEHRDLLLARNDMPVDKQEADTVRLHGGGRGQTLAGRRKYAEAIAACGDERYLEYNVSQLARQFGLDGTGLGNQLRVHYPELLAWRERERMLRGLGDNQQRGARPWCVRQYAEAVAMLRETDLTIRQVAEACNVSFTGLRGHVLQYHRELVGERSEKRASGRNSRTPGALNGNGVLNGPSTAKTEEFREAVELYRTTLLPLEEIAERSGVSLNGLTYHLYRWHRELVLARKGIAGSGADPQMDLSKTRHFLQSTAVKYAGAVASLEQGAESLSQVARSFGFKAETLRDYVRTHRPDLAERYGRIRLENGRNILSRCGGKYAGAVELYRTSGEPLKSIAERLGLVYNSLSGFIRRNCPEAVAEHRKRCSPALPPQE